MGILDSAPMLRDRPAAFDVPDWAGPAVDPSADDVPVLQLFIDGSWRASSSGQTIEVHSPIDGSLVSRAQRAGQEDVEAAIAAARAARADFRALPAARRLAICEDAAELMADRLQTFVDVIVVELGKIPEAAESEADATRERLQLVREEVRKIFGEYLPGDWIPDAVGKRAIVIREPVGTVAAFGPFNYPLFLSASKIIPAIAAGNTVVAKAPSDDPTALLLFARVLEDAGLPPGVLNVISGPGSEIGELFATHQDISMVSFTGSTGVGKRLSEIAGPKPLHMELGGNAAGIVLSDADLELAAETTVQGAYKSAGQRCDAISRVLVERAVYDEYVERAAAEAERWTLGDPRAEGVRVGPLVSQGAAEWVHGLVQDALDKGAKLLVGGGMEAAYHEPTVLADVPLEADIVWEEQFGPVLPVLAVADLEEALEVSNRSRYGLDSAVYTSSLDRAWKAARGLECGMVTVNDAPKHGVGHFPFGGRKPDSGIGREGLGYSIDECTDLKTIVMPT
ncbi:MAG: aldehyde dehydrogenase family protein [Actinomycetota bacterium]|nr:aldehyde dehydrogenase family protein [Actinomycetota bacterium]